MAVDQHHLGAEALVVHVEPVDHVRRSVVGRLGPQEEVRVAVAAADVGPALRLHVLRGLRALEDVAEAGREREVHVVEVRHVDDVVDELAAVRALDRHDLPRPVGVGVGADAGQLGRQQVAVGRRALDVVPDQQLAVADLGGVLLGTGPQRHPTGVGDGLAAPVAAPAPVVEGAGDLVALHAALGQVAAHVAAVGVEDVQPALAVLPDDQLATEAPDAVRLAVGEGARQAQAVPPTGVALGGGALVEMAGGAGRAAHVCLQTYRWTKTRTGYSFLLCGASHTRRLAAGVPTDAETHHAPGPRARAARPARGAA